MKLLKASELEVGRKYRRQKDGEVYIFDGHDGYTAFFKMDDEEQRQLQFDISDRWSDTAFEVGEEILVFDRYKDGTLCDGLPREFIAYVHGVHKPFLVKAAMDNETGKTIPAFYADAKRIPKPVEEKPVKDIKSDELSNIDAAVEWARWWGTPDAHKTRPEPFICPSFEDAAKGILEMHEALKKYQTPVDEFVEDGVATPLAAAVNLAMRIIDIPQCPLSNKGALLLARQILVLDNTRKQQEEFIAYLKAQIDVVYLARCI